MQTSKTDAQDCIDFKQDCIDFQIVSSALTVKAQFCISIFVVISQMHLGNVPLAYSHNS